MEELLILLATYIILTIFAFSEAKAKALYLDKYKKNYKKSYNGKHWKKIIFIVPILSMWVYTFGWASIFGILVLPLYYIFMNHGYYYYKANKLNGLFPLGFKDKPLVQKTTFPIDWNNRVGLMFLWGLFTFAMVYASNILT